MQRTKTHKPPLIIKIISARNDQSKHKASVKKIEEREMQTTEMYEPKVKKECTSRLKHNAKSTILTLGHKMLPSQNDMCLSVA